MPPKKLPKAKVAAKRPALKKAPTKEEVLNEDLEGQQQLELVLTEIFLCYDLDEDGQIERVEFLEGEEGRLGKLEFGPKQRREAIQWFKAAGAEGTPADGMYLSRGQLFEALTQRAREALAADAAEATAASCDVAQEPTRLALWLWENWAKDLIEACYGRIATSKGTTAEEVAKLKVKFKEMDVNNDGVLQFDELIDLLRKGNPDMPTSALETLFNALGKQRSGEVNFNEFVDFIFSEPKTGTGEGQAAAASGVPTYPVTIAFRDLKEAMDRAQKAGRMILVLASGKPQVETFFQYQTNSAVDCKKMIAEMHVQKSKTKDEARMEASERLKGAMHYMGFSKPLWIRMSNSAFDWVNFCTEEFPADVFSGSLWSLDHAHECGLLTDSQKFALSIDDEKKWKDFVVIITSEFNLEQANEYLFDKIPHYDELAIIEVDPNSID